MLHAVPPHVRTLPATLLGRLAAETQDRLHQCLEPVALRRGEVLFRAGDPSDAVYLVVHGRLLVAPSDPAAPPLGDVLPGESVGEWGLLADEPRSADVIAARRALLYRLPAHAFQELCDRDATFATHFARHAVQTVRRSGAGVRERRACRVWLVIRDAPGRPDAFVGALVAALGRLGRVRHLREADAPDGEREHWLDEAEAHADHLVIDVAAPGGAWHVQGLERADHLVWVASSGAEPHHRPWERLVAGVESPRLRPDCSLVLVHPPSAPRPRHTARWYEGRHLAAHYHARLDRPADAPRIARSLTGQAVGVVLGGGAARAASHLGVLAALTERGVPIDYIGGTSAGGGIGATVAAHDTYDDILETVARCFVDDVPFKPGLPLLGMFRREPADATARRMSTHDGDLEDLWIPCFMVSTRIDTGERIVHRRGSAWKAVRATTAVPGLVPPMILDGAVLVDGGVLDNLPVETMKALCGGPVIASDANGSPEAADSYRHYEDLPGPLCLLRSLWSRGGPALPTISRVLTQIAMVGDRARAQTRDDACAVIVRPDLSGFSPARFGAFHTIAAAGYTQAGSALDGVDLASLVPGWHAHDPTCHDGPAAALGDVLKRLLRTTRGARRARRAALSRAGRGGPR